MKKQIKRKNKDKNIRTYQKSQTLVYNPPPKANEVDAKLELSDQGMSSLLFDEVREAYEYRELMTPKLPIVYLQDCYLRLQRQNNQCKSFLQKWYPVLKEHGFKPFECRKILEADAFKFGWRPRTLLQYWPPEAKDTFHSMIGSKGGKAKAYYSQMLIDQVDSGKKDVGMRMADQETRQRVSSIGGNAKTPEQQAEAGHIGGNAVKERYGLQPFSDMGRAAADHREEKIELIENESEIKPDDKEEKKYLSNIVSIQKLEEIVMDAIDNKYEYVDIRVDPKTCKILSFYMFNKQTKTNTA